MTADAGGSELQTLKKVVSRLDQAGVPYLLTGSMALNFYGHPRASNDFDLVVGIRERDEERIFDLFRDGFYVTRESILQALTQRSLFNIIDNETIFKVDLIVRKDGAYATEQFKRRRIKEFGGLKTFVISPEDLILAKLDWSRDSLSEIQERDIRGLIRLLDKELDYPYLEKWAVFLGCLDRLRGFYVSS